MLCNTAGVDSRVLEGPIHMTTPDTEKKLLEVAGDRVTVTFLLFLVLRSLKS